MKVLHINCVYPVGSTGRITSDIHEYLIKNNHESFVLYSRGPKRIGNNAIRVCNVFESKVNHFISRISGLMYGGCIRGTGKIIKVIKKENPDIVHLQCINGYFVNIYKLISYLKKSKIPTVITLHAEFMHTANCACTFDCNKWINGCGECPTLYKSTESYFVDRTAESFNKMKVAFSGFGDRINIVGVSEWLSSQAKKSPIMKDLNIVTIHNGIDTATFYPRNYKKARKNFGFKEHEAIVLWVTSVYSEDKGKIEFQKLVSLFNEFDNTRFVVAGAKDATINNDNIDFLGRVNNKEELAELYSAADVVICCSKQESFPTVSLEAQCCGTPVIGFDVGGVAESIIWGMGKVVPVKDIEAMKAAIIEFGEKKKNLEYKILDNILEEYSSERMAHKYLLLYKLMLGDLDGIKL